MSSGPSLLQDTLPHTVNVVVHVVFGTLALILGLVPLLAKKGSPTHIRYGRYFLACLTVVVLTAVAGIAVFRFRAFLGVITMLAAYEAYSGVRALRIRTTGPQAQDALVSLFGLLATALFLIYLHSVRVPWSPAVIYSTLGALVAVAAYDLVRFAFPRAWFRRLWLYEHLIKMIGAYNAVVSAFAGTVFPGWQPFSQLAPSIAGLIAMTGFIVYVRRRESALNAQLLRRGLSGHHADVGDGLPFGH